MLRRPLWDNAGFVAVIVLGIRVCYLVTQYVVGGASVQRFHVESAAFLLVVVGLCYRAARSSTDTSIVPVPKFTNGFVVFVGFGALAFALYWRALSIGFLSDDFLLIHRASAWQVGAVNLEFFRPVPITIWALLLHVGVGAKTIHALNIALHATNAWLTVHLASRWIGDRGWRLAAGLVMVTMPLAPEAVAWCSGVFDVMATTLVLAAVLTARRYGDMPSMATRISFVAIGLLALVSKETAAILPILVLLDAWVRRAFSRKLLQDTLAFFAILAVISVIRLSLRFGVTAPSIGLGAWRRTLFRSFGSLAFPWHVDVVHSFPLVPLVAGLLFVGLVTAFLLHAGRTSSTRAAVAGAAWVITAILPVFHVFFVSPDLQASRYLYLSSVGWAVLIASLAADFPTTNLWSRIVPRAVIIMFAAASVFGVRMHLQPWIAAANLRDIVERQAAQDNRMRRCDRILLANVPDSIDGAYVFRVGAREEFARALRLNAFVGNEPGPCSFRWDGETSTFAVIEN